MGRKQRPVLGHAVGQVAGPAVVGLGFVGMGGHGGFDVNPFVAPLADGKALEIIVFRVGVAHAAPRLGTYSILGRGEERCVSRRR